MPDSKAVLNIDTIGQFHLNPEDIDMVMECGTYIDDITCRYDPKVMGPRIVNSGVVTYKISFPQYIGEKIGTMTDGVMGFYKYDATLWIGDRVFSIKGLYWLGKNKFGADNVSIIYG